MTTTSTLITAHSRRTSLQLLSSPDDISSVSHSAPSLLTSSPIINTYTQHRSSISQRTLAHHLSLPLKTVTTAASDLLCYVTLYAIHFIYLIYIVLTVPKSLFTQTLNHYHNNDVSTAARIARDKSHLTKLPSHLSIVVSQELMHERTSDDWDTIIDDLCLASCWAWQFGIQEMSVFDASGVLKSMTVEIQKRQSCALHNWMKSSNQPRPAITFSVLSGQDGVASIAQKAQQLVDEPLNAIDINMIDRKLHDGTFSDPDLMIIYDGLPHHYICIDGFPPWHIRLTEIVNRSNHHRLDYNMFSSCLYQFSKVEQRFGR
ncbi:Decaprenyl diphosphate synthase-like protein [Radiomyces spectabilis]|uniref:Decaprenyl diphosphate synthase-like protein n=1 Tax=Radiomyces spectabilis TaxID=64574 RepID=UPI00221FDBD3|nr:Decaprenyl diphosphate synthase-like protein [Radiomyces spectabilis]KAI8368116.1 Decaprenyl diphosphate synthase-like protein [Radiomyces spectabilis]